jgi:hypothetical protein
LLCFATSVYFLSGVLALHIDKIQKV